MGLKCEVTAETILECAKHVESLITPGCTNLIHRARLLVNHIWEHLDTLAFSDEDFATLMDISFVPTMNVLQDGAYSAPMLGKLSELCLPEYLRLVWTQTAIFHNAVLPSPDVCDRLPWLGQPRIATVVGHLREVAQNISRSLVGLSNEIMLCNVVSEIYRWLQDALDEGEDRKAELKANLNQNLPVFLNNKGPFDAESWVPASYLAFGIMEGNRSGTIQVVHQNLRPYKRLLLFVGAKVENSVDFDLDFVEKPDFQLLTLIKNQLELLEAQTVYSHDVKFTFMDGACMYASSYVLAAGGMTRFGRTDERPRLMNEYMIEIPMDAFRIVVRYVYGADLDADISARREQIDDQTENGKRAYQTLLLNLLRAANSYGLNDMRKRIERRIVRSGCICPRNVENMRRWAEGFGAVHLQEYCVKYMAENRDLMDSPEAI